MNMLEHLLADAGLVIAFVTHGNVIKNLKSFNDEMGKSSFYQSKTAEVVNIIY